MDSSIYAVSANDSLKRKIHHTTFMSSTSACVRVKQKPVVASH